MEKLLKPCGYVDSQGVRYLLLNPYPLPKDSCWNDGTYMFFVAAVQEDGSHKADHIITNAFCLKYDADMPSTSVYNITDEEENQTYEPWDDDLDIDGYPEGLALGMPEPELVEEELPF